MIPELYSCGQHGPVTAWLWTARPGNVIPVPKISPFLGVGVQYKIYRNIILPVVFYGCEAWSLTAMEERKLRVFENMVLRIIFGPRRDEVTEDWRSLHKRN